MEDIITNKLKCAVATWDTLPNSCIKYSYLYRYYPPMCGFKLTDRELNDRELIWSFRQSPKIISQIPHQKSIGLVSIRLEKLLSKLFKDSFYELVFVCIPASNQLENIIRYEAFSKDLSQDMCMINAYPHITFKEDRGVKQIQNESDSLDRLQFDEQFFKGKNVLLFDDIMVTGYSFAHFANKLSSLGANIVAAIAVGRTFYHRRKEYIPPKIRTVFRSIIDGFEE